MRERVRIQDQPIAGALPLWSANLNAPPLPADRAAHTAGPAKVM